MIPPEWFRARPLGFVDVGARGGVHPLVAPIASQVAVLGFEPDEEACSALNREAHPYAALVCLPVALSNREGHALLYRFAASTNDSLCPVNQRFVDRYRMEKFRPSGPESWVPVTTLDAALLGHPGQGEFLKLDTQGTEYEVLEGAKRTIGESTVAIYCEVEFHPIYRGQALFGDVAGLLGVHGFSFFGFDNIGHRSRQFLGKTGKGERWLHADAVFFKDPLEPRNAEMSERERQVVFTAAMLTGYIDFSMELVEAGLVKP